MESSISKEATWGYLLRFALPTIVSMLVMSTFGIVDGVFVSRLIDPIALSAVGIVFPFVSFAMAIGLMLGVGGNALVAKKIGAGMAASGRQNFSLIALVAFVLSLVISVLGITFPDTLLGILGVDDFVRPMALEYLTPMMYFMPAIILGMVLSQFLITVGKAHYIAVMSVVSGIVSASLNYVFIYMLGMGLRGAAIATSIGFTLPAIVGIVYFTFNRSGDIYFVAPKFELGVIGRASINGSSEMVTMLAVSVTTVLMNNILIGLEGPEAVAAASVAFGGVGIFSAFFVGYSAGVIPIISYNFGAGDKANLRRVYINSLRLIAFLSALAVGLAFLLTDLLISVFGIPSATPIYDMAVLGFRFVSIGFVFAGFNTFASMFFTGLNNGLVSAVLSLFRTLVFVVICFMILPDIFGLYGAWAAMPVAEVLGVVMTVFFLKVMRVRYGY